MKKAMIIIMISITAAFLFTMLGVFIGRMTKDGVVTISSADSVRKETVEMEETIFIKVSLHLLIFGMHLWKQILKRTNQL